MVWSMSSGSSLLREWRKRHGVTQEELAATTGIAQSLLSKYERGPNVPGLQNALRIAAATLRTLPDGTVDSVPVESWQEPLALRAAAKVA